MLSTGGGFRADHRLHSEPNHPLAACECLPPVLLGHFQAGLRHGATHLAQRPAGAGSAYYWYAGRVPQPGARSAKQMGCSQQQQVEGGPALQADAYRRRVQRDYNGTPH